MEKNESGIRSSLKAVIIVVSAYIGVQMISDISSLQIVSVLGNALDGGTFIYPLSFTLRDVSQKILGKKGARVLILCSAALNLAMALMFWIIGLLPIDLEAGGSQNWTMVLTPVWRVTLASIVAATLSELLDTEVYSWFVEKVTTGHQWARVLVSNCCSIPLDSLIFSFGAFYGTMPLSSVMEVFWGNVAVKLLVTLISIPLIYTVKDPNGSAA